MSDAPFMEDLRTFVHEQVVHITCRPEDVERFKEVLAAEPGFFRVTGDENVPVGKAYAWRGDYHKGFPNA
jgi:hypothetical protein